MNRTDINKTSAALDLTFERGINIYDNTRKCRQAVHRLLCTASLLPSLCFIGLQLSAKRNACQVFSSPEACVSAEDYGWIFEKCAAAADTDAGMPEDLFSGGRKVYALTSACFAAGDEFDDADPVFDNAVTVEQAAELLRMLNETGATVRICIMQSGASSGRGVILLSLTSEMTLRLKSMISMIFNNVTAAEVKDPEDACSRLLSDGEITECTVKLLTSLMYREENREAPRAKPGNGSIDELDLSVRAYNCLKRAGITTVQRLKELKDEDYAAIRNLGQKAAEEIKQKLAAYKSVPAASKSGCTDHMAALDRLVGLAAVKEQIKKAAALAKMKKAFAEQGRGDLPVSLHMAFVGSPGTAKTTVARLVAGIFCEVGLLSDPTLVEAGRADLVAKYVGQTAAQVRDVFSRAKGRVLFIDEAYSLIDDRESSFGDEAIHTIVAEMENRRADTVVIFAGYPDRMEDFFERNPGLRSRVPFFIRFEDYSADEMIKICELEAQSRGFEIDADAYGKIRLICSDNAARNGAGNGRLCRNVVEAAILNYAERNYGGGCGAGGGFVLTAEDFAPCVSGGGKRPRIGFCA